MSGRRTQFDAVGVGLRPPVGDPLSCLVRPLGAFERMFYLSEQKSTKHFCMWPSWLTTWIRPRLAPAY